MPTKLWPRDALPAAAAQVLAQRLLQARGAPPMRPHVRSDEDQQLYDACRWDYALFAKTFLLHWCPDAFNQLHLDYYARLASRHGSRGHFDATAAPRGHAKTMACALVTIVHSCVYQTEAYTIYLTYRYEDAVNKVRDVRDELTSNPDLLRVYGPQEGITWNNADFTTLHGQRVRAASSQTQLRGALSRGQRPTRVLLDDAEHAERVLSQDQRIKTWDWLVKEILHLGQPQTNYEVFGTILHEESMLKTLLTTPGWTTTFYQAVQTFAHPDSIPLWQAWRDRFLDLTGAAFDTDAETFFAEHQEAMLAGTQVLWPTRRPYVDLMQSRLREGESSFWQELQGRPLGDTRYVFDLEAAAFCKVMPHGIVRAGGVLVPWNDIVQVGAYWDPVADKKDIKGTDFACCTMMAQDRSGYLYVLDAYVERQTSTDAQITAIVDLLWRWSCTLLGVETNGFQGLLVSNVREAVKARALAEHAPEFDVQLVSIVNVRNKVLRINSLEPLFNNHWLQLAEGLPAEFLRQFANWLPIDGAGHDDCPDSVEGAVRVVRHQYEKKDVN